MNQEQIYIKKGNKILKEPIKRRITDRPAYFLTKEEIKALKETAYKHGELTITYSTIIMLMVNCGLRRSEAVNLKIEDIDFDNKMVMLGEDTKTGVPRKIPYNDELERNIKLLVRNRDNGYLLMHKSKNNSKRKYTPEQVNNIIGRLGREANIKPKQQNLKNLNPHLFRHAFVKLCAEANIPKEHVRIMGGWKSMKMIDLIYGTPTYDNITKEMKEKMDW